MKYRNESFAALMTACLLAAQDGLAQDCTDESDQSIAQAAQKVALLERLLSGSEPAQRVQAIGDAGAREKLAAAEQALADAKQALDDRCGSAATTHSVQGLRLASIAFQTTVSATSLRVKQKFDQELQQSMSLLLSLESQPLEAQGLGKEDLVGIERQIEHAEAIASDGKFAEATELLRPVSDRLQRRLLEILDDKTLYYEKSFATPRDEYLYLLQQYHGYRLLLQSDQKQASYSARQRIDDFLSEARQLWQRAETMAAAERLDEAISAMHVAVDKIEQAVHATGYSY